MSSDATRLNDVSQLLATPGPRDSLGQGGCDITIQPFPNPLPNDQGATNSQQRSEKLPERVPSEETIVQELRRELQEANQALSEHVKELQNQQNEWNYERVRWEEEQNDLYEKLETSQRNLLICQNEINEFREKLGQTENWAVSQDRAYQAELGRLHRQLKTTEITLQKAESERKTLVQNIMILENQVDNGYRRFDKLQSWFDKCLFEIETSAQRCLSVTTVHSEISTMPNFYATSDKVTALQQALKIAHESVSRTLELCEAVQVRMASLENALEQPGGCEEKREEKMPEFSCESHEQSGSDTQTSRSSLPTPSISKRLDFDFVNESYFSAHEAGFYTDSADESSAASFARYRPGQISNSASGSADSLRPSLSSSILRRTQPVRPDDPPELALALARESLEGTVLGGAYFPILKSDEVQLALRTPNLFLKPTFGFGFHQSPE